LNHYHPEINNHVASTIQTATIFAALLFTYISITFLEESNLTIKRQTELTNSLLDIERKRETQANSISAYLAIKVKTEVDETRFVDPYKSVSALFDGKLIFDNRSKQPVYEVVGSLSRKEKSPMGEDFLITYFIVRVLPPEDKQEENFAIDEPTETYLKIDEPVTVSLMTSKIKKIEGRYAVSIKFKDAIGDAYERTQAGLIRKISNEEHQDLYEKAVEKMDAGE